VELGREKEVSKELAKLDKVSEVYVMTGEYDILVKVDAENPEEMLDFIIEKIRKIDGVEDTRTVFAKKIK
jgi:DNA-binding Lrp family transcriptional regulator